MTIHAQIICIFPFITYLSIISCQNTSPVPSFSPVLSNTRTPTIKPSKPTSQPITASPTMSRICSQISSCSSPTVICPKPGFNTLTEGGGAVGTYYYVMHGNFPVVYNASATISNATLNHGTDTTICTQAYSRSLDDDGVKDCDAGHILANQLGGTGSQPINIFPQDLHINRGAYRSLETKIYDCVSTTGVNASLHWQFIYQNNTETKPTSVIYSATFASGSCAPGFSQELTNCYTLCSIYANTNAPYFSPSMVPSLIPSIQSISPLSAPSYVQSCSPSVSPSSSPSISPSMFTSSTLPSCNPSLSDSNILSPSAIVSVIPSVIPSTTPSETSSDIPSAIPSIIPSAIVSAIPSATSSVTSSSIASKISSTSPTSISTDSSSSSVGYTPSFGPTSIQLPTGEVSTLGPSASPYLLLNVSAPVMVTSSAPNSIKSSPATSNSLGSIGGVPVLVIIILSAIIGCIIIILGPWFLFCRQKPRMRTDSVRLGLSESGYGNSFKGYISEGDEL